MDKIITAGLNHFHQISQKADIEQIDPAIQEPFDFDNYRSYSIYSTFCVVVTKQQEALAIGSNYGKQIMNSDEEFFTNWTKIQFQNDETHDRFTSAVCGSCYTLYLTPYGQLILQKANTPTIYLDRNINPSHLYGGDNTAAVINRNKSVLLIDSDCGTKVLKINNETPIQIACLQKSFIVLCLNGRLYEISSLLDDDDDDDFEEVKGFSNIKFACISGTASHCIAVSVEGDVYVRGKNNNGQLGISSTRKIVSKFISIQKFTDMPIVAAFAGYDFSLFMDEEGGVFSCGNNGNGQLMLKNRNDEDDEEGPKMTVVESGASFCFAGNDVCVVFKSNEPPSMTPNKLTNSNYMTNKMKMMKKEAAEKSRKIQEERAKQMKLAKNAKQKNKKASGKNDSNDDNDGDVKSNVFQKDQMNDVADDVMSNVSQKDQMNDVAEIQKVEASDVMPTKTRNNKHVASDVTKEQISKDIKILSDAVLNQSNFLKKLKQENNNMMNYLDSLLEQIDAICQKEAANANGNKQKNAKKVIESYDYDYEYD